MEYDEFRNDIRAIVKSKGLNYTDIENELKLSPKIISRFITNRISMKELSFIPEIAKHLGIDLVPMSTDSQKKQLIRKGRNNPLFFNTMGLRDLNTKTFLDCVIIFTKFVDSKNVKMTVDEAMPLLMGFYQYSTENGETSMDEFLLKSYSLR